MLSDRHVHLYKNWCLDESDWLVLVRKSFTKEVEYSWVMRLFFEPFSGCNVLQYAIRYNCVRCKLV